jgi:phosphate starvation-inducible PhoH-like protein|tara:strand:- start:10415 stop:11323 length:909 start_codon:yes stop_codon:yes gene_type:complete
MKGYSLDVSDNSNVKQPKKRGRKPKKQVEKELLKGYYFDMETMNENYSEDYSIYKNMEMLSNYEKEEFEKKFTKPKNDSQTEYLKLLKNKNKKIIISTGPAGTGKTLFATEQGIKNFLVNKYEKIIFTRPSVSVDEELGFLPGTLEDKMAPWIRPIYDILYNFLSVKEVTQMVEEKYIEIAPLGFMRGRTFKNSWIIADEMQNSTVSQMKMLLTRLGENSRIVITGDLEQHDRKDGINGLEDFLNKFKKKRSNSISSVEFGVSDIQREKIVQEVLDIYSNEKIPETYLDCSGNIDCSGNTTK